MRQFSVSTPALLVVLAGCAPKRQAVPVSIPVPLASALIDSRGYTPLGSPKYSVGEYPPGYPKVLTPTGPFRIIGGLTSGYETIAIFADSTRRLAAILEQVFAQNGYTRPKPRPGSGFSPESGPFSEFCGDSGAVSVYPLAGSNASLTRVTYRRLRTNESCRGYESPEEFSPKLALPQLKPPAGVRVGSSGGGGGSDEVNSRAEMTGADLSASAIVAHYAAQLVAAGWTAEAPAVGEHVAAQYFVARDTSGRTWSGILVASGDNTALSLSLNMHRRRFR